MSLVIKGKITEIQPIESGTSKAGKAWTRGGIVVDTGAQYNPHIAFTMFGEEKANETKNYTPGQEVEVSFNLSSRENNGRWYTSADAWRVNIVEAGATQAPAAPSNEGEPDDLPF
mgnify:CR=1 FL=1